MPDTASRDTTMKARPFTKILIANRGEIAARVIRTAKSLGFRTVAVYSEADKDAPHTLMADQAVYIGPSPVGESYLCADKIINACQKTKADAIHPGYGFLSENADFANACEKAGITFIAPPAAAIELMGSKRLSKIAMLKAGVPCVPGYEGDDQSDENLVAQAKDIGLPVMIKASAGGGGRGMRLVHEASELAEQIKTARSEATNAFGNGELIIEKAVIGPRHIEIQVFCDQHGNAVYLGERDCSIQRRHQKVVEEAPSPFVDDALRQKMGEAAVQAAKACNYIGAGTVEFLVDEEKNFYFLEMNTRLQVEHPVTELVTGTDLVAWQLNVALGAPLPKSQKEISLTGHAIEVRFYAEDPANDFMPQTGKILQWQPASGEGIRIDAGITTNQTITPFYDPMLAKIIAYGENREEARRKLALAIEDSTLFGVTTNAEFLCNVLNHEVFATGQATTAFIEEHFSQDSSMKATQATTLSNALAATILHQQLNKNKTLSALSGWRNSNNTPWPYELKCGETLVELTVTQTDTQLVIQTENAQLSLTIEHISNDQITFIYDDVRQRCQCFRQGEQVFLKLGPTYFTYEDLTHAAAISKDAAGTGKIVASMDGSIVDVQVNEGDNVKKGKTLVVLEAMKMEHPLKADMDGKVSRLSVATGDQVKIRQQLVQIDAELEK